MIVPDTLPTIGTVARHYDELDPFYREVWGEHVHHGYWLTGRESAAQAADALSDLVAQRLRLGAGQSVCDIGCGYGATGERLAEQFRCHVTGVTVSAAQAALAGSRKVRAGSLRVKRQDWLLNDFAEASFDRAYAIESTEHMADLRRFFDEAYRTLKPGGVLAVCAWLARTDPRRWEVRHLLQPICREGRLAGMGTEADYRWAAREAGFRVIGFEDISDRVRRTWSICARRVLGYLVTRPRYLRFLFDRTMENRIFVVTLLRLLIAYRTRSMRYCVFVFEK